MTGLPKVVSPLVTVGEREGVELILVSVEAWPDEVVVRMRGRPSSLTQRMEDEFDALLGRWHREGARKPPPDQPAEQILGFQIALSDDAGTDYKLFSSSRGGTNTLFRAEWTLRPGPPNSVQLLTVGIGDVGEVEIDLASD